MRCQVIQYFEQSANKGSVDAALTLGHIHYHGARGESFPPTRVHRKGRHRLACQPLLFP